MTRWRKAGRWLGLVAAFGLWTFVAGSCAGIVAMGGAHTESGEWPVGATVALGIVYLTWILVPAAMWWRRRRSVGQTP